MREKSKEKEGCLGDKSIKAPHDVTRLVGGGSGGAGMRKGCKQVRKINQGSVSL